MDKCLFDIFCCLVSKMLVWFVLWMELEVVNWFIGVGMLQMVGGQIVIVWIDEVLIIVDGKVIYWVEDGILVMLFEEGIGILQLGDLFVV